MKKKLLFIDADISLQNQSVPILMRMGYTVSVAGSGIAALAILEAIKFDVGLIDLGLAGLDGSDLLSTLEHREPGMDLILMVDESRNVTRNQPLRLSGHPLLTKPLTRISQRVSQNSKWFGCKQLQTLAAPSF
jgi:DNA-binding NtrC family response regulator